MISLKKKILIPTIAGIIFIALIIIIAAYGFFRMAKAVDDMMEPDDFDRKTLANVVESHRKYTYKKLKEHGCEKYINVVLCIMEYEGDHGNKTDVFNVVQKGLVEKCDSQEESIDAFVPYFADIVKHTGYKAEDIFAENGELLPTNDADNSIYVILQCVNYGKEYYDFLVERAKEEGADAKPTHSTLNSTNYYLSLVTDVAGYETDADGNLIKDVDGNLKPIYKTPRYTQEEVNAKGYNSSYSNYVSSIFYFLDYGIEPAYPLDYYPTELITAKFESQSLFERAFGSKTITSSDQSDKYSNKPEEAYISCLFTATDGIGREVVNVYAPVSGYITLRTESDGECIIINTAETGEKKVAIYGYKFILKNVERLNEIVTGTKVEKGQLIGTLRETTSTPPFMFKTYYDNLYYSYLYMGIYAYALDGWISPWYFYTSEPDTIYEIWFGPMDDNETPSLGQFKDKYRDKDVMRVHPNSIKLFQLYYPETAEKE